MQSPNTKQERPEQSDADRRLLAHVRRARVGGYVGEQARSTLVKEHYSWIVQRCLQTLGNEADALDAAQEVALRMHKSLSRFEGRSSLRTWLNTLIRNECINLIRRQQRVALTGQITALIRIYEEEQRGATPDTDAEQAVHRALEQLSPEHREVLNLRFFGELPIAEIGRLLGITLSAAKMRLYRAMEAFKAVFLAGGEPKIAA